MAAVMKCMDDFMTARRQCAGRNLTFTDLRALFEIVLILNTV